MKRKARFPHGTRVAVFSLSMFLLAGQSGAQQGPSEDLAVTDADKARVIAVWDLGARRQAMPRDLVIDPRGLGYLRLRDGSLAPHGHQIAAESAAASANPLARPPSASDSTGPSIANMTPGEGATIGASASFSATVTDTESGVRSVSFVFVYPDGQTQAFDAAQGANDSWSVALQGFSDGIWSWSVEARDGAKAGGNRSSAGPVTFTVDTGGSTGGSTGGDTGDSGNGSDTVTNAEWTSGGNVQTAAGRIYFQMPSNARRRGPWSAYVCSGTAVTDNTTGRSTILTAAHCIYDDVNKAFARNVRFIPDQAGTNGTRTDTNCDNDPLGCWVPSFGVVDREWTIRTFPDNIPWDYGFYVVPDAGAHAGSSAPEALDSAVAALDVSFATPYVEDSVPGAGSPDFTHALGYSYSDDPNFMYCAEDMTRQGSVNWWLSSCGLSGGSSGGPWVQPLISGSGPVISVNSWGYSNQPGMAGPRLDVSSANCVFTMAKSIPWSAISSADGDAGDAIACP
ncbi:MAG: hypothetical protein ACWGPN_15510, partial [Gammaproteobacteria bacterium]